jgi:hypothetical protein
MNPLLRLCVLYAVSSFAAFAEEEPKPGSLSEEGNVILHVFHSADSKRVMLPVALQDDYGFMVFNDGSEDKPKLHIRIGSRKEKKVFEAYNWEEAKTIVAKLPEGARIHYYGKCLCPTYYTLPEDTWDKMMGLLKGRKLVYVEEEDRITCYCPRNGG